MLTRGGQYDFTVSEAVMAPDGYLTNMTVVNGQFPGPTVEADWGDTVRKLPRQNPGVKVQVTEDCRNYGPQ